MKFKTVYQFLKNQILRIDNAFLFVFCFCISNFAFAENLLANEVGDAKETFSGGFVPVIYMVEGVGGTFALIKTRSPWSVFITVLVIALTHFISKKVGG